jgi:S1-C subfamily serine protease
MNRLCACFLALGLMWPCLAVCAAEDPDIIAKLFSEKADAIVMIAVESKDGDRLGSGFFISRDGKIVTNYHLISGARKVVVKTKKGSVYLPQRIVQLDPAKDIAVIQIEADRVNYLRMGDSNGVVVGQRVLTIGSPMGLESTVADGLVSSVRMSGIGLKLFQISVPLSNGSSGGPLIDLEGKVVGITTASFMKGQNLNFAVPINYVKTILKKPFDPAKFKAEPWQEASRPKTKPQPQADQPQTSKPPHYHVVESGDTLYGIAKKYKISAKELMRVNRLTTSRIVPGQRLILP